MAIILASASPRRKELLEQMGLSFTVQPADCKEPACKTDPKIYVATLAGRKAAKVAQTAAAGDIIIGADTLVVCDGQVMGKPADREEAKRMLQKLSGKPHSVFSGYAVIKVDGDWSAGGADVTDVTFANMADWEIAQYLDTEEYQDKAGGYAIQGQAGKYITSIAGSYATVVGLPIHKIYQALKEMGEIQ